MEALAVGGSSSTGGSFPSSRALPGDPRRLPSPERLEGGGSLRPSSKKRSRPSSSGLIEVRLPTGHAVSRCRGQRPKNPRSSWEHVFWIPIDVLIQIDQPEIHHHLRMGVDGLHLGTIDRLTERPVEWLASNHRPDARAGTALVDENFSNLSQTADATSKVLRQPIEIISWCRSAREIYLAHVWIPGTYSGCIHPGLASAQDSVSLRRAAFLASL